MNTRTRINTFAAVILAALLPTAAMAGQPGIGQGQSVAMAEHLAQTTQPLAQNIDSHSGPFVRTAALDHVGQGQSDAMAATNRHNTQPVNLGSEQVARNAIAHRADGAISGGESAAMAQAYQYQQHNAEQTDNDLALN